MSWLPEDVSTFGPGIDLLVQLLSHEIRNPLLAIKTFTFPSLSIRADRVTDVIKGTSVRDSHVVIRVKHCPVTAGCGSVLARTVATDHHGRWARTNTSDFP